MKKNITISNMKKIAENLMIDLDKQELELLMDEVKSSIEDLEKLKIFDTEKYDIHNVDGMNYIEVKTNNTFRQDKPIEFEHKKELLNNVSEIEKKLVKV